MKCVTVTLPCLINGILKERRRDFKVNDNYTDKMNLNSRFPSKMSILAQIYDRTP